MSDFKLRLQSIQNAIQAGEYQTALTEAQEMIGQDPASGEAHYMAAVAARYLKKYDLAHDSLRQLHSVMPEYGRAWQEAGHLARDQGQSDVAHDAYSRAVKFNPALEASWRMLAEIDEENGRLAESKVASAQVQRLHGLPKELVAVTHHLHEGRLLRAEEIARHFLRSNRTNVEGMRLLAQIGMKLGVLDDAEFLLESAASFEPENVQVRLDYIDVLRRRQKYSRACEEAEALYSRDKGNPLFQSHLAINRMQTGDFDGAFELFDQVLLRVPNDPSTLTSKGHALKTIGDQPAAVASYQHAITAKSDHGDAFYALANLKTYEFTDSEIDVMRSQIERPDLAFMDRVHISFALGKAYEDRGEYEASFQNYEAGNTLKRAQTRYSADAMTRELARQKQVCTGDLFAKHEGAGHKAPDPIFVLGLPRAGSTLLEQILASHSKIDGTLELPNILALAHRLRGRKAGESRYPNILHDLAAEQLAKLGEQFIEETRIHRQGAPYFIDKMPNNFRHIGLIHLILPNAKIIDARRAPLDCCFSGFKQLFAEGQEFTYGLQEIGRYYSDYVALMDHWNKVLPGKILRVQHEDVLDDLEGQTRRMLDFVGVPFEEGCLQFHKTDRAVRTASSEQVRQPINRKGQNAWEPFEPWLDPLKEALAGSN